MAEIISAGDSGVVEKAASLLRRGELVVYPTDTVYGIGAAVSNEEAVRRVYEIKGRSPDKAVPLLIADARDAESIAEPAELARRLMERFWPGGLTIVMPRRPGFRSPALGGEDAVALRVPDEEIVREVVRAIGEAITGTSANRSGQPPPARAEEAATQVGDRVALVIDGGPRGGGKESTVVDITSTPARIVRQGAVSRADLEEVLGEALE